MSGIAKKIETELLKKASTKKATSAQRFFKTGPGQYGEGDQFLGVKVPETRGIVKQYSKEASLEDINILFRSKWHEVRLAACLLLVAKYKSKISDAEKRKYLKFYLGNSKYINNWDLVDVSAASLLGRICLDLDQKKILTKLAKSSYHWERRMAVVATLAFIKAGDISVIYQLSDMVKNDKEDLMHKALGWMLREAGKIDKQKLREFLLRKGAELPRTSIRYAIEHFSLNQRQNLLLQTRAEKV